MCVQNLQIKKGRLRQLELKRNFIKGKINSLSARAIRPLYLDFNGVRASGAHAINRISPERMALEKQYQHVLRAYYAAEKELAMLNIA